MEALKNSIFTAINSVTFDSEAVVFINEKHLKNKAFSN
jgi:hypothetical protein